MVEVLVTEGEKTPLISPPAFGHIPLSLNYTVYSQFRGGVTPSPPVPDAILSLSKLTDPMARVPVCGVFGRQKRDPMGMRANVHTKR